MYEKILLEPIQATSLDSWHTNINNPDLNQHFLGFYEGTEFRLLLKFDLSDLPLGSEIIEANLKMYCNQNSTKWQEKYYNVHSIIQEWSVENTTWKMQPAYDTQKKVQTGVKSNIFEFITWDITAFARTWQASQDLNFGVILTAEKRNDQETLLGFSGLSRGEEWRPRLELALRVPQSKYAIPRLNFISGLSSNLSPRIAILTPQFFEWSGDRCLFGGGERYLIDFVNLLQKMGYQVDVFQPSIGQWEKTYESVKIIGLGNATFDMDFFRERTDFSTSVRRI